MRVYMNFITELIKEKGEENIKYKTETNELPSMFSNLERKEKKTISWDESLNVKILRTCAKQITDSFPC